MSLTLNQAKKNLIKAQKEAQRAYKNVEKAREVYNKLVINDKKKSIIKKRYIIGKKSTKSKSTKSKSSKSKSSKIKKKSVTKKKSMSRMRGGGGSDWLSTVNSRGNVAGLNDHWGVNGAKWFDQFEKSGDYISISELRKGGYELQKSASQAPKVPTGNDLYAQQYQVFGYGSDLGTQRI